MYDSNKDQWSHYFMLTLVAVPDKKQLLHTGGALKVKESTNESIPMGWGESPLSTLTCLLHDYILQVAISHGSTVIVGSWWSNMLWSILQEHAIEVLQQTTWHALSLLFTLHQSPSRSSNCFWYTWRFWSLTTMHMRTSQSSKQSHWSTSTILTPRPGTVLGKTPKAFTI